VWVAASLIVRCGRTTSSRSGSTRRSVVVIETGETIGFVGLSHPLWLPGYASEVGWRLVRSAWSRGFATEAGREAVRVGFGAPMDVYSINRAL
jgi:RimJ/RimL family protein N-acetyltransferase